MEIRQFYIKYHLNGKTITRTFDTAIEVEFNIKDTAQDKHLKLLLKAVELHNSCSASVKASEGKIKTTDICFMIVSRLD